MRKSFKASVNISKNLKSSPALAYLLIEKISNKGKNFSFKCFNNLSFVQKTSYLSLCFAPSSSYSWSNKVSHLTPNSWFLCPKGTNVGYRITQNSPSNSGQNLWNQECPLFGGFTVNNKAISTRSRRPTMCGLCVHSSRIKLTLMDIYWFTRQIILSLYLFTSNYLPIYLFTSNYLLNWHWFQPKCWKVHKCWYFWTSTKR